MIVIGITGEIGTGKTKTTQILKKMGYSVFSSDECCKSLIKEKSVNNRIRFLFENKVKKIITDNCEINTVELGEYLFNNPKDLNKLESLLHPLVKLKEKQFLTQASIIREKTVFLDIPIMFVNKNFLKCDFIINLLVNKQIQKKRVISRPQMTEKKLENILIRQKYDKKKYFKHISLSINTGNGTFFVLKKIKKFLKIIKKKKNYKGLATKVYIF